MSCRLRVICSVAVDDTVSPRNELAFATRGTATRFVKTCQKFSDASLQSRDIVARMSEVPALLPPLTDCSTTCSPSQPHPRSRLWTTCWVAAAAATLALSGFVVVVGKRDVPPPVEQMSGRAPHTPESEPSIAPPAEAEVAEWISHRLTHLHVRPQWRAAALGVDDAALIRDLSEAISELWVGKLTGNEDAIFVGGSIDGKEWRKLRASINPTGVVWRISSRRSASPRVDVAAAAVAAGFARGPSVHYSADYVAEQFTPRRKARQRPGH
jgi:hypothetical protein